MDDFVAATYLRELIHQAEAAKIAAEDLQCALSTRDATGVPRAFAAAQSLLAASAMISKMLWPSPSDANRDGSPLDEPEKTQRQATLERGRFLRSALGIKGIPILESRKVRNALEHFDDRLDRYFADGNTNVFDRNIGPRSSLIVVDGAVPLHLRLIDPQAGTISVMDDEVGLQDLFDAVQDVGRRASDWIERH